MERPAKGMTGIRACFHSRRRGCLTVSTSPSHTTSASLTASEGCAVKPPISIQLRLPPIS